MEEKATGIAFCVRSAAEYFRVPVDGNLTVASFSYYYGTLSLLKALLLSGDNDLTLSTLENWTRFGHGLRLLTSDEEEFPVSEKLVVMPNGFFTQFLRANGIDASALTVAKPEQTWETTGPEDRKKALTVKDLLARIPELRNLFIDLFQEQPRYLSFTFPTNPAITEVEVTFPERQNSPYLSNDDIMDILSWPRSVELTRDEVGNVKSAGPLPRHLVEGLTFYGSFNAYDCYVKPAGVLDDVLLYYFLLLYALGIWVRYRPALWRDVSEGDLDQYKPLLAGFLAYTERIVPNIVLDRLYGKRLLFAPFSFWA